MAPFSGHLPMWLVRSFYHIDQEVNRADPFCCFRRSVPRRIRSIHPGDPAGRDEAPKKVSWIIWAILDNITLGSMLAKGSANGQILGAGAGALTVAFLAIERGRPGWTSLDKFCLGGAALAVTLWQMFDSPEIGLITSLTATFVGSVPTFKNVWNRPEEEDRLAWTLF